MNVAIPLSPITFVNADVNVVFPLSTFPIVPMFTCGFFRSYFAFAISPPHRTCSTRKRSVSFDHGGYRRHLLLTIEVAKLSLSIRTGVSTGTSRRNVAGRAHFLPLQLTTDNGRTPYWLRPCDGHLPVFLRMRRCYSRHPTILPPASQPCFFRHGP